MDLIKIEDLKMLTARHQEPSISIYIPTHRRGSETEQDPIRFKNMLARVEKSLEEKGYRRNEINELLKPARSLLAGKNFWQYLSDGLAVFIAPGEFNYYRLPIALDEFSLVSDRYHVKPLLPILSVDGHFFALALSQKNLRLYEGTLNGIRDIELSGVPKSLDDILKFDDPEKQLQYHTGTPRGKRQAMFHGHGVGGDESKDKRDIIRYYQAVDNGIYKLLGGENSPLLLIGHEHLISHYKNVNSYPYLLEKAVTINPDDLSESEMHKKAWEIIEPLNKERVDEAVNRYEETIGTGLASNDFEKNLRASLESRIDTLFVAKNTHKWGRYNPNTFEFEDHDEYQSGDIDLMDFATANTILNRGEVYALDKEEMPGNSLLAAIYRF